MLNSKLNLKRETLRCQKVRRKKYKSILCVFREN